MRPIEAVIAGAAETDRIGTVPDRSVMALHVEAARNALADCGLTIHDVDGLATVSPPSGPGPVPVAHALGVAPAWLDGTTVGGCSFLVHVRHALAAIEAGHCTTVLVTHGESGRSRVGMLPRPVDPTSPHAQFERPYGAQRPPTLFTLPALRWMHETGTTPEQLASVVTAQRAWSSRVERAQRREPMTVDEVLASPLVAYPFHRPECCLVTDGGGALVLTTAERAAQLPLRTPPVRVLGSGESCEGPLVSAMEDLTSFGAMRRSSAAAFAAAGIAHEDVDHLMVYDAFAHLPLYGLEDMGFVGRGEAGAFVAEGHTQPGGRLPLNTNGGGLAYTHTGMYGMFALQESIRQLRGEAAAQVPGVEIGVVQGLGGQFAAAATLVLGTVTS